MTANRFSLVFIDLTTTATPQSLKPGPVMQPMIDALIEGLMGGFAEEYGHADIALRVGGVSDRDATEIAVNFRDTLPDAPGALAYHTVTGGVADIEVGVDLFDGMLTGADPMSAGVDHEIKEMLGDLGANGWKDRQDGSGTMDAEEFCDFVQNTYIKASNGATLSNFVRRSFFVPGSDGPWDYLGVMKSHYDVSNGYGITATSPDSTDQIGGMRVPAGGRSEFVRPHTRVIVQGHLTAKQAKRKAFALSRTMRRKVHPDHLGLLVSK